MFGNELEDNPSNDTPASTLNRRHYLKVASIAGTGLGSGVLSSEFSTPVKAAPSVIEDFNRSSPLSDYDGETGGEDYQIVTDTLEPDGSPTKTLKATGTWGDLGHNNVSTPRGYEYRVRIEVGDNSVGPSLLTCVQNTSSAIDDCYWALVDQNSSELDLILRQNGSGTKLTSSSMPSLTTGAIYELAVELDSSSVRAILYDSDGSTVVADTGSASDSTWSGGQLGFYTGGGSYPAYYDYVTKDSLGSSDDGSSQESFVIDDFEDGDLSEYDFDRGSTGASLVSSPTQSGSSALEYAGTNIEAVSTTGLDAYPSSGDTFSFWVRASGGGDNLNVTWGVQTTNPHKNRYYAKLKPTDGSFYLFKYKDGSGDQRDYTSGLSLSQDVWYEIEVQWASSGGDQTVTLYDSSGTQLAQLSMTDTEWSSGGIGYDAYLSSGESVYFDYVTLSEATQLGSFESGLEGWTATGSNSLSRVDGSQQPAAVTEGDYALDVTVNSDSEPSIENQQLVQNADFENNPCLLADVLPSSVENSDSAVTFRFRYHHSDPGGVEESPEHTVNQQYGGRVCWDMSSLSATKLSNPDQLEIVWYPENHPPSSGFDYNGVVYVDNIHLSNNHDRVALTRCVRKRRELERVHGLRVDTVVQSESDTVQDGVFEYEDGTQIDYRAKLLSDGTRKLEIDGETFHFKEGFK